MSDFARSGSPKSEEPDGMRRSATKRRFSATTPVGLGCYAGVNTGVLWIINFL